MNAMSFLNQRDNDKVVRMLEIKYFYNLSCYVEKSDYQCKNNQQPVKALLYILLRAVIQSNRMLFSHFIHKIRRCFNSAEEIIKGKVFVRRVYIVAWKPEPHKNDISIQ